jgi:hypothetical protein
MANERGVKGSRQRYGMLLLALSATFVFEGVAEPGDVQRSVQTVLVGAIATKLRTHRRVGTSTCSI